MVLSRTYVKVGSVKCSVQMYFFYLYNRKSYLLLGVCLIDYNLSRSCQDGVCSVLSALFDYPCTRKAHLYQFYRESVLLD